MIINVDDNYRIVNENDAWIIQKKGDRAWYTIVEYKRLIDACDRLIGYKIWDEKPKYIVDYFIAHEKAMDLVKIKIRDIVPEGMQ